jgi:hypothetical protein
MERKTHIEENRLLWPNEHDDYHLYTAYKDDARQGRTPTRASIDERLQLLLVQASGRRCLAVTPEPLSRSMPSSGLGIESLGKFFHSPQLNLPALALATHSRRRKKVEQKKEEADPYHDSESEDIFDLYNACNGVLRNGLLDKRKLDELSLEERKVLNVARLRAIWAHTAAGCAKCEAIIRTLNRVRGVLSEDAEEPFQA